MPPHLHADVVRLFDDLEASRMTAYAYGYAKSFDDTYDGGEKRQCWTIAEQEVVQQLRGANR